MPTMNVRGGSLLKHFAHSSTSEIWILQGLPYDHTLSTVTVYPQLALKPPPCGDGVEPLVSALDEDFMRYGKFENAA